MREELRTDVTVGRPLWFLESFFREEGTSDYHHELNLVYAMRLPDESSLGQYSDHFYGGAEKYGRLVFWWLPLRDLNEETPLYPVFLRQALHHLPPTIEHVIYVQPDE